MRACSQKRAGWLIFLRSCEQCCVFKKTEGLGKREVLVYGRKVLFGKYY
jgi:hypothetical protein